MQLNRRYIRGLQFAVAYTLAKTDQRRDDATTRSGPVTAWNVGPDSATQFQNFIVSYTWDLPKGSKLWNHALTRGLLDGWQLSGDTALVSGDWSGASTSTTDNFDFTGGDGGTRPRISGETICTSGNCDPAPGGGGSFLNAAAFSRLTGARRYRQRAASRSSSCRGSSTRTCPCSRTSRWAATRRIQLRWEVYNLFNQVNWSAINTNAQFNPAGQHGQRELRTGDRGPQRAESCRARFGFSF